ncbi:hypothetical protein MHU86_13016 [Fragilaria crotonensis]|nr:hypothetical protein MHU86_13016 [Fragilaria crotonensis]
MRLSYSRNTVPEAPARAGMPLSHWQQEYDIVSDGFWKKRQVLWSRREWRLWIFFIFFFAYLSCVLLVMCTAIVIYAYTGLPYSLIWSGGFILAFKALTRYLEALLEGIMSEDRDATSQLVDDCRHQLEALDAKYEAYAFDLFRYSMFRSPYDTFELEFICRMNPADEEDFDRSNNSVVQSPPKETVVISEVDALNVCIV